VKILYLAHRIPYPPNKGEKIRSFNQIRHFAKKHEVHLLAFRDRPEDEGFEKELMEFCCSVTIIPMRRSLQLARAAVSLFRGRPWSLGFFKSLRMRRAVGERLHSIPFDLVFVYSSSMAQYAEGTNTVPKFLDFVDSDASKWRQYSAIKAPPFSWLYGYEARSLGKFEALMVRRFNACSFVGPREATHLTQPDLRRKILFVQNGINIDFFQPPVGNRSEPIIIFTGAMDYFPNVDAVHFFVKEVFPTIQASVADVRFLIVGSQPNRAVRKLGQLPGIRVTGTVKDVRPFLAQARVAVAPIRVSQGIQNKILEALASGLPVVATPNAAAGLTDIGDFPITVAENGPAFASNVIRLLSSADLTPSTVQRTRDRLRQMYDWDTNLAKFDTAFSSLEST
jgi:sugar transferase (PEP-CTERM/EpsH1 system associated)